jgi:hypothetical protein
MIFDGPATAAEAQALLRADLGGTGGASLNPK